MDERLARGAAEFNAGKFFTAHETWESLWLDSVGTEKILLQGLVQIAAGYAKVESGLRGGALKLLGRGRELVRQYLGGGTPASLPPFIDGVGADIERLRRQPEASVSLDLVQPPVLRLDASGPAPITSLRRA